MVGISVINLQGLCVCMRLYAFVIFSIRQFGFVHGLIRIQPNAEREQIAKERIDTTYGDIAEFGGEGPETRRINVEGDNMCIVLCQRMCVGMCRACHRRAEWL